MNPDDWQRLEAVFFAALEIPLAERSAWLDRACGGDAELRAEVEAVLAAHVASGGSDAMTAGGAGEASDPPDALAGSRIGPYQLGERIGRGGMGVVYLAHRVDEQYRREVAIKLVRAEFGTEKMTHRFRNERQILANLQHPNIATLLDGGVTQDGQPYLVMQYVRGAPITTYADSHQLSVAERLRLFRTVCEAVQYAHANLVVHRDLKPSNILVTDTGDVRLLDFGIAKLLAPDDVGGEAALTTDTFILTPEHAAPEQIERRPITTATDVYALGVLLYELLAGVRPFTATSPVELCRAICETEPMRPSSAVDARARHDVNRARAPGGGLASIVSSSQPASRGQPPVAIDAADVARQRGVRPHELARQLRGDVDHIVLMALRKEPTRRYASAGQLAEDVTRFLDSRPVLARPDAVAYRARRFVGRNRMAVSLAAVVAFSLVAGLIGTTSQARRARGEAAKAAADRDRAERVSALLVDVFRLSDPSAMRGQMATAHEVLTQGAARISSDLAGQPEAQADLLTEVGHIYENLGLFDDASARLEHAIGLRRSLHGDRHPRVAEGLTSLARVRTHQQRADEAVELARTAVAALEGAGTSRNPHPSLANALLALGDALRAALYSTEAAEAFAEALSLLERQRDRDDARIAQAIFGQAHAAHSQGRFDLADSLLEETVVRFGRLGGPPHPDAATSMHNLGMLRMFRRRPAEAEPLLRQALELRLRIYGPVHPTVAETLVGLGHSLSLLGRFTDALAFAEESVAVADSAWGRDHTSAADARTALGFILSKVDEGERAVTVLREAISIQQSQLGPDHAFVFGCEIMIGQAYLSMGQFDLAREHFLRTLDGVIANLGPDHAYRAHVLLELARLDLDGGRLDAAEATAQESLDVTLDVLRPDHRFALWAKGVIARVHAAHGRLASADSLLQEVLDAQQASLGQEHPEVAGTLVLLADVRTRLGQPERAEADARRALAIFAATGARGAELATAGSALGGALAGQGRIHEAEPLLRDAVQELARARGARPIDIEAATERLRRLTAPAVPGDS